jgi:hypothetical protein
MQTLRWPVSDLPELRFPFRSPIRLVRYGC